jgi:hypothetical protein
MGNLKEAVNMMIDFHVKRLCTTKDTEKKEEVENILTENKIPYFTRIDDMFWENFMGEHRFVSSRKAPQTYSIFVYKTYRDEDYKNAKLLTAGVIRK